MADENNRIAKLLKDALQNPGMFTPGSNNSCDEIIETCLELYERDNICTTISNQNGIICGSYPFKLIVPIKQRGTIGTINDANKHNDVCIDATTIASRQFMELTAKGRLARTRGRFPIPSVLIGNKFICRSSTLARSAEMYAQQYAQQGYQYFMKGSSSSTNVQKDQSELKSKAESPVPDNVLPGEQIVHFNKDSFEISNSDVPINEKKKLKNPIKFIRNLTQPMNDSDQDNEWLLDKMRKTDIDILRKLKVNVICDLMVENKKVKYGMNVTSSEKVDRFNRYRAFDLIGIPYPGCEFFADYSRNAYKSAGLMFNWNQAFIDAELQVPGYVSNISGVDWKNYMDWDLVLLTQNYFKLILKCLISPQSSGILLHCISGWDRTPLFITFVRLSLWADGLIHQSLTAEEVVYLTLAYDWLLFSHQFYDRIYKNEEIMHFCFDFFKHMLTEEFSVLPAIQSVEHPFLYFDKTEEILNGSSESNGFANESNGAHDDAVRVGNDSANMGDVQIGVEDFSATSSDVQACLQSVVSTVAQNCTLSSPGDVTGQDSRSSCSCNSHCDCKNGAPSSNSDASDQQSISNGQFSSRLTEPNAESSGDLDTKHSEPNIFFRNSSPGADSEATDHSTLLPSQHDSSINNANSFASSTAPPAVNGESHASNAEDDSVLRLKLEKRREKLLMARNIMLPAYCSVVPKQKELMKEQSGISGLMGSLGTSLANFVKRA